MGDDGNLSAIGWCLLALDHDHDRVYMLEEIGAHEMDMVLALGNMVVGALGTDAREVLLRWQAEQLDRLATQEVNHDEH